MLQEINLSISSLPSSIEQDSSNIRGWDGLGGRGIGSLGDLKVGRRGDWEVGWLGGWKSGRLDDWEEGWIWKRRGDSIGLNACNVFVKNGSWMFLGEIRGIVITGTEYTFDLSVYLMDCEYDAKMTSLFRCLSANYARCTSTILGCIATNRVIIRPILVDLSQMKQNRHNSVAFDSCRRSWNVPLLFNTNVSLGICLLR